MTPAPQPQLPPVIPVPPLIPASQPPKPPRIRRFKKRYVVAIIAVVLLGWSAKAVTGYFFLGSEATALRETVTARVGGRLEKKFALRLGWITTGLLKTGCRLFELPPEPRSVINALDSVEVGIYKLSPGSESSQPGEILAATDAMMSKRNWDRIVGVMHHDQAVAIYVPRRGLSGSNIECAVLVMNENDLIVAAGKGNPTPLIELASRQMAEERH